MRRGCSSANPPWRREQAAEILKVFPEQADALALSGLALGALGQGEEAIAALRRAVHFKPGLAEAWRALGDHYTALEMREAADEAFAQHLRHSTRDPKLMEAALALVENRIPDAEATLREHLKRHPTDVVAIRMLAEVAARIGRTHDAENLLAALRRAGAGLSHGAPELRHDAAPAEQVGRGAAGSRTGCWWMSRPIRDCAISRRPCSAASASTKPRSTCIAPCCATTPASPRCG